MIFSENLISFENSQSITFSEIIPPGTYTISSVVESSDIDATYCLLLFYYNDNATKEININRSAAGERKSVIAEFTKSVTKVRIYAGANYNGSVGDTATFTKFLIESDSPESEIEQYYKALAGYSTEYPESTCRETKLIHKLLDANYQLDFAVTEQSSRVEKYLLDLINGTTEMLSNVPKTDTEKVLHKLIGGEVADYSPINCDRNYWMLNCLE